MSNYLKPPQNSPLILASASPRRVQLLEAAGITPGLILPADIDETPARNERPEDYCLRMAREKAAAIATHHQDAFIVAADTVVACGRRILPKAESPAQAEDCLKLLSGRRHKVYGGICLTCPDGSVRIRRSLSRVIFRLLSTEDIKAYLDCGDWQGKAGGYAIQGQASLYIRQITGSYSNIVGLDMYQLAGLLLAAGFSYERS